MIDIRNLPALEGDATVESLMETFNARLLYAESASEYVGNWTPCVKVGPRDADVVQLPTVRLAYACHKAELERARATVFASYLLQVGRDEARALWLKAVDYETPEFMAWCRQDIEWKKDNSPHLSNPQSQ